MLKATGSREIFKDEAVNENREASGGYVVHDSRDAPEDMAIESYCRLYSCLVLALRSLLGLRTEIGANGCTRNPT